ncbi:23S rRNA pseudouridine2604 synthase [Pedobacter sp. UYP30]|uniref:23S rRNA pseudouridine(2604) synthase RluF n=1 Tax=Pedobacter sp. UYP30 TaxID=1756400 RepID=UPI0033950E4A
MNSNSSTRLNKFISESGLCSRREADRFIEKGNVFINGKRANVGDQVLAGDRVMVNGHTIEPKKEDAFVLIAFNKPVGITSTTEKNVPANIVDYVNYSERIFPIGRLDKDSSGLIFLTNNGDIVNKILRAGNKHEKEYVVTVNKALTEDFIVEMAAGVPILGVNTRKCQVRQISTNVFSIILVQGLNRQVRRMCEHFGYEVIRLERTRIMNITLKGIPPGEFRELAEDEMITLMESVEKSSSQGTAKPKNTKKKTENWEKDTDARADVPKKSFSKPKASHKATGKKPSFKASTKSSSKPNGKSDPAPAKKKTLKGKRTTKATHLRRNS